MSAHEPAMPLNLDTSWTDDDGRPYGDWVEINEDELAAILLEAGDCAALTVFSSLTDPDGCYGRGRIYKALGYLGGLYPLVDVTDDYDHGLEGGVTRRIMRKFVPVPAGGGNGD